MNFEIKYAKYTVDITAAFKKDYKKISKQSKDKLKLKETVFKLANGIKL